MNPNLLGKGALNPDAEERVEQYKARMPTPMGAYTGNSKGYIFIRELIADYIAKRDGIPKPSIENIFVTTGASEGVRSTLGILLRDPNDCVLVPIPQYPLYSALITAMNGTRLDYYMDEEKNWALHIDEIKETIEKSKSEGKNVRSLVVINPGNPTGQVLSYENIKDVIKLCYEHNILIMADEVYQTNIYKDGAEFHSFRKVLHEMGEPYASSNELISYHSVSKGHMGECGFRGGYMELHNLDPFALDMIYKMKSIELCAPTVGQVTVGLMVDPPTKSSVSTDTWEQFSSELGEIQTGHKERAKLLTERFN